MPFYAMLIIGGLVALLGAFLLGGDYFRPRRKRSASGAGGSDPGGS